MICRECHSRSRDELAWQRCGGMHAFTAKVHEVCSNEDLTKQSEENLGGPCTKTFVESMMDVPQQSLR